MPRRRSKHHPLTLVRIGRVRVTLTTANDDWREYLFWQLSLLVLAFSILITLSLLTVSQSSTNEALLLAGTLPADVFAASVLWWLIQRAYSRSKRFAAAFLLLGDLLLKLLVLRQLLLVEDSAAFTLLLWGTGAYFAGTGIIGLIVFLRGDEVVPWWRAKR